LHRYKISTNIVYLRPNKPTLESIHPILLLIIGVNVLVSFKGFENDSFFNRYKFQVNAVRTGDKKRLWTAGFLHVDFSHLLFNMFALYIFADIVLYNLGIFLFVILYFVCLYIGNLFTYIYHKNQGYYSAVGASGAVSGIVYAAILLNPSMNLYLFFIPIPIPGIVFGVGYLLYSMYGMKKQTGNIGHTAHFGGAAAGFIATLLMQPSVVIQQPIMVGLLAIPIVLMAYLIKKDKL